MAGRRRVGDRSGPRAEGVETRERRGAGFFHPPVRGLPMTFDPITAILNIGGKVIDKVWPDPTEAAKAKVRMMEMAQAGELEALKADVQVALAQIEVNKAEAQSGSLFIGGWRPAVGWVRSEEHTSELQSLMRISYAGFCLKKTTNN